MAEVKFPKLLSITFKATPRMPGVRASDLATIDVAKPGDALKGWKVAIRGQQVFFMSPAGWTRDQNEKKRDPHGPATVFEIPRAEVYFEWQGSAEEFEALYKGGKWESPPFGPPPRPPEERPEAAVPPNQLGD